jgi:hypothetical protein
MQLSTRFGAACALAFACSACASAGELERGSFRYSCTTSEDATCWDGNMGPRAVPPSFAISAGFDISFEGDGGPFEVEPASPTLGVRLPIGAIQLNEAGRQALLAREVPTGLVKDFAYISGYRSRAMRLTAQRELGATPLDAITPTPGEPLTYHVRVVGDGGATLAGGITFSYRVEDDAVAQVAPMAEDSSQFEVSALMSDASTNVYVSTGSLEEVYAIVIGAAP